MAVNKGAMPVFTISQALQHALTDHHAGRHVQAQAICREVLALEPRRPEAWHLLGLIAAADGRMDDAIADISKAIAHAPDQATYYSNLGVLLRRNGRVEEAIAPLRRAAELRPDFASVHLNLGDALRAAGMVDEAIEEARKTVALDPKHAGARVNLGNGLMDRSEYAAALQCFEEAVVIDPAYGLAFNGRANALMELGHPLEALADAERAIALEPDTAAAHMNRGILLLLFGKYEEGWKEYEWRNRLLPNRPCGTPRWNGQPVKGSTLLLRAEQGLGDMLQFVRYVPLAERSAQGPRVVITCPEGLVRLLKESGGFNAEVVSPGDVAGMSVDFELPLMSLPLVLGVVEPLTCDSYLHPVSRIHIETPTAAHRLRVGLVWSGNTVPDRRRSIPIDLLKPLVGAPNVAWHSLQVDRKEPLLQGMIDLAPHITDFADTAALMAGLDLIITVDTAAAHLAGALGRPVWTLLPFVPDWRWGLEREDTPWYPTMRLFRQRTAGDWGEVIERVARELGSLVG